MNATSAPLGLLHMTVDVVHRNHHWVGLLVASCLWKHAWCLLIPWNLVVRGRAFGLVQGQGPWALFPKCMMFSNRNLSSSSEWQLKVTGGLLWESFDNLDQQIIKGLLMFSVRDFGRWSLTLEGALSAQMRKVHWNYACIFIQITTCIIGVSLVNNMMTCDFSRHPYFCFSPPNFFCMYLLPSPSNVPFPIYLIRWLLSHYTPFYCSTNSLLYKSLILLS